MSDFINDFWGWYVGIITIVSIVGCVILVKWMEGGARDRIRTDNPCFTKAVLYR